jgi:branched-chain amino acid transport system ATP-binding protein
MDGVEPAHAAMNSVDSLVQTSGLTKDFRGFRAVDGVDLTITEGTIHALVGPNGAGKTTLFNLLTGFLVPTSGTIVYRGQDITGKAPEKIAHLGIARSFQITSLFDQLTGLEHLELALASPTGLGMRFWRSESRMGQFRERSLELIDEVGLAHLADQVVGSLAYGQKRALELALALALDPSLLLLDEPTAGMGMEDVDRTIALVRQVAKGRTVVLVDHNMHVVGSLADQVTVLQQGKILAEGSYEHVRMDDKVITAYLGHAHA